MTTLASSLVFRFMIMIFISPCACVFMQGSDVAFLGFFSVVLILKTQYHPECIACVVENCHLGNDSQSELYIQQTNRFKTKGQACKAAWVNMGL